MKSTWLLLAVLAVFFAGCSRKSVAFVNSFSPAIHKKKLIYENGYNGQYYHRCNAGSSNAPILFIIGGSGHSSARYSLAFLARPLKQVNADIYMLQKRHVRNRETGMGKDRRSFVADYYFSQMVADQEYFIKMILSKPENKKRKVILLGISEGATIAAKVAADLPATGYLAIIGSGGMQPADEFRVAYASQKDKLELLYADIKKHPESRDTLAIGYTYKYWSNILFEDPMNYFLKLGIPVLAGMGEKDENVPIASARYLDSVFTARHKTNLTYIEYKGCDHTLTDEKGKRHEVDFFSKLNAMVEK